MKHAAEVTRQFCAPVITQGTYFRKHSVPLVSNALVSLVIGDVVGIHKRGDAAKLCPRTQGDVREDHLVEIAWESRKRHCRRPVDGVRVHTRDIPAVHQSLRPTDMPQGGKRQSSMHSRIEPRTLCLFPPRGRHFPRVAGGSPSPWHPRRDSSALLHSFFLAPPILRCRRVRLRPSRCCKHYGFTDTEQTPKVNSHAAEGVLPLLPPGH